MCLYRRFVLPRLMNLAMSSREGNLLRESALARVEGEVLEIGFGTGLNLPFYPRRVRRITAVDPNRGMLKAAREQIAATDIDVLTRVDDAQRLSFPDNSFDSVVSTWTLCSIDKLDQALREVYRVLKPGGAFYFLEHGLSPERWVRAIQHFVTPIHYVVSDGCRANRNMRAAIRAPNWTIERYIEYYAQGFPKFAGYMYQGVARKPN
jgi:ubiquinone/menaquinone biosynthesis C-methylase UbiE